MKYFSTFLLLMVCSSIPVSAQEQVDTAAVMLIKDEGMNHSQVMEISSWLADVYAPRLNWSPEYRKAAEWASTKLKEFGAENIHFENFSPVGTGWTMKKFYFSVTEPHAFPVIAFPKAWSQATHGTVSSDMVILDAVTEGDLTKFHGKLKGKIILISEPITLKPHFQPDAERDADSVLLRLANRGVSTQGRMGRPRMDSVAMVRALLNSKKLEFCQKEGAAAILEANPGDDGTLLYVQGAAVPQPPLMPGDYTSPRKNPYDPDASPLIPQVTVAAEHYNRIYRALQKGIRVKAEMRLDIETTAADSSFNIIAEIPGTDLKNEVVLLGGHFDTWHSGTGATDNGSGVAVCMEAIRILKKLGLQPRRTIRIGLWGGEEEGLLGSRAYVKKHYAERPDTNRSQSITDSRGLIIKPEESSFSVYFNDDHGGGKVRGMFLQGNEAARNIFRSWFSVVADPTAQTISAINTGGTDHLSFNEVGLPAFQFIQDPMDYGSRTRHATMDVYDRLVEDDMKQTATIMAVFVYNAAMRDSMFPRKPQPTVR
ncbi:MAG: M20/M25/M40 family metallo-hydrolase [Ignavibacteriae bacterium]|nr:MAG: M20/M25/M40 family metallo-hydrolase [Ignavibacteriota bacterium]